MKKVAVGFEPTRNISELYECMELVKYSIERKDDDARSFFIGQSSNDWAVMKAEHLVEEALETTPGGPLSLAFLVCTLASNVSNALFQLNAWAEMDDVEEGDD